MNISSCRWMSFFLRTICLFVAASISALPQTEASEGQQYLSDLGLPKRLSVAVIGTDTPLEAMKDGQLTGFSGELLNMLLATDSALELHRYATRDDTMRAACRGDVDLVLGAVPLPEFADCLVYSSGYFERRAMLVARSGDERALDASFLRHAQIIVETGTPWATELRLQYPQARLLGVSSPHDAMRALRDGHGDVYVGSAVLITRMLAEKDNQDLTGLRRLDMGNTAYRFGAPLKSAEVVRELDRRLALFPDIAMEHLRNKWLGGVETGSPKEFVLLPSEKVLLSAHRTIRYTAPSLQFPFASQDAQGRLSGLTVDYLDYLRKLLNVEFVHVPSNSPEDALARLARGEIDLIAGSVSEPVDDSALVSAGIYASIPAAIVTAASTPYTTGLEALRGRKIAVIAASTIARTLHEKLPDARVTEVDDFQSGFELLRNHAADAMIGNLLTLDALVRGEAGQDMRIAGAAGFDQDFGLWLSARQASLGHVLQRALSSMPATERNRISQRWTAVKYQFDTPWTMLLARYWVVLALTALVILLLVVAYFRLHYQVRRRRQIEDRLARELALKETLLACLPQPIVAKDTEHRYVEMNSAFEQFFGVRKTDYLGQADLALKEPTSSIQILRELQQQALETMEVRHATVPLLNAQCEKRTVIAWAVPYPLADGSVGGVVAMYQDVTEIHEARQRALRAEQQLKDVTRSLPAVVFQLRRRQGDKEWQVSYIAGDISGRQEVDGALVNRRGERCPQVFRQADTRRLEQELNQSDGFSAPIDLELELVDEFGGGWVHLSAVPKKDGELQMWNGVISDVTDRHRQEEALREAKEVAEAALRAKEGFLAMMSHEIRTPMNGVLGLVEVLQTTELCDEQRRLLALAKESGQALAQILDDILDYAKIEAGRLSITPEPLDLRELIDSVLSLLLPQAHEKGLQLRLGVDARVPATVHADGIRVRQILFNLLGNAIKFTSHGSVRLHARVESMDSQSAVVVVSVEDTGIGIPRDDIQHLFAPFVQSERSAARRFGGTGLGLSISRRLAELMGGQVTLESAEGVGTIASLRIPCSILCAEYDLPLLKTRPAVLAVRDVESRESLAAFAMAAGMRLLDRHPEAIHFVDADHPEDAGRSKYVIQVSTVPKQLGYRVEAGTARLSVNPLRWMAFLAATTTLTGNPAQPPAGPMPAQAPALPCRKVLVVEDHPINREVIQQQLRLLCCTSVVAENGEQALLALAREEFDLILTDCHMPVMNGFDLTTRIRASDDPQLRSIPVVGVTATTVREELRRCLDVGMNTYVLKPTTLASLQKALAAAASDAPPDIEHSRSTHPVERDELAAALADLLHDADTCRLFSGALRDDRESLRIALEKGSIDELRAWCHRARGAISMFGMAALDEIVDSFHRTLRTGAIPAAESSPTAALLAMYDQLIGIFEKATTAARTGNYEAMTP
ncbi:Sensor histidine kinase RcsC [compost metagenome]